SGQGRFPCVTSAERKSENHERLLLIRTANARKVAHHRTSVLAGNPSAAATVTRLLARVDDGDAGALAELVGVLHEELRLVARRHRVRWGGNETLCTTALVNEAYLKLARQEQLNLTDRAHFLALAGRAMRHILCNYAESRSRLKRGAGVSA